MKHVEVAKKTTKRSDLERRLTGRYYTPLKIADGLAEQAVAACPRANVICDPFCGDGRLIVAWIRAADRAASLHHVRQVQLWDYDEHAVQQARASVCSELSSRGLEAVEVVAVVGDTFERTRHYQRTADLVITNPPWELLKPDSRDRIENSEGYTHHLRAYAETLAASFPGARSAKGKALTGYGVNLARAGAIAAEMLTAPGGALAIVLPSNIFADQASGPFRREFFSRVRARHLDWYPAEARLFNGVDQPFVTIAAIAGESTSEFTIRRHSDNLCVLEERLAVAVDLEKPVALNVNGAHEQLVARIAAGNVTLENMQSDPRFGLWLGRELDETRIAESAADAGSGVPFLKGRHVFPFRVEQDDVLHIDPTKRKIPDSVKRHRLAWRDVARPTQRRRMHVALVPEGAVTGNSLGVGYFEHGPAEQIQILMAVMNSFVFELQVRTLLATAHISLGVLRKCVVPLRCFTDGNERQRLLALIGSPHVLQPETAELEVAIARAYNVSRDDFRSLLDAFPKVTRAQRESFLRADLWA